MDLGSIVIMATGSVAILGVTAMLDTARAHAALRAEPGAAAVHVRPSWWVVAFVAIGLLLALEMCVFMAFMAMIGKRAVALFMLLAAGVFSTAYFTHVLLRMRRQAYVVTRETVTFADGMTRCWRDVQFVSVVSHQKVRVRFADRTLELDDYLVGWGDTLGTLCEVLAPEVIAEADRLRLRRILSLVPMKKPRA